MSGLPTSNLVLDSTYLLPAFGVELSSDPAEEIAQTLDLLIGRGFSIYISELTPLECFLKAFRLAEKQDDKDGKKAAKQGLLSVAKNTSMYSIVSYLEEEILAEAAAIKESHRDPFDCFIFATAKVLDATLVTEDIAARKYIDAGRVSSWKSIKKRL